MLGNLAHPVTEEGEEAATGVGGRKGVETIGGEALIGRIKRSEGVFLFRLHGLKELSEKAGRTEGRESWREVKRKLEHREPLSISSMAGSSCKGPG